jgi:hypothetical protein
MFSYVCYVTLPNFRALFLVPAQWRRRMHTIPLWIASFSLLWGRTRAVHTDCGRAYAAFTDTGKEKKLFGAKVAYLPFLKAMSRLWQPKLKMKLILD